MTTMFLWLYSLLILSLTTFFGGSAIYVDQGIPYNDGPLAVGSLVFTISEDKSPLHTKVYFPLQAGNYSVVFFIGGLNGIVLAEFYSDFLKKLASHGFFVIGVDYKWPVLQPALQQDMTPFLKEIDYVRHHLPNKTLGTPVWNRLSLMCHSSGCDFTLRMIRQNNTGFTASVFLEPYSADAKVPMEVSLPALMYGTQLAEEGVVRCNIPGTDYNQFYRIWGCPKIVLEVADFGHCDILDLTEWIGCHDTHFCKTTNSSRLTEYRQFVQGAVASFLETYLQGRPDAITYIDDVSKVPLKLLLHKSDLNCVGRK